jgi:hypothetical protein
MRMKHNPFPYVRFPGVEPRASPWGSAHQDDTERDRKREKEKNKLTLEAQFYQDLRTHC